MDEEIQSLPIELAESENIKDIILGSVKSQLEDWLNKTLTISCISEEIERRYKINKSDIHECSKEIRRLEREIEDCKDQNKHHLTEICKIRTFLDDILTDLRLKAYQGDLEKVKILLEDKCSWDFAQEIMNKTKTLATVNDLESLKQSHEDFKEKAVRDFELKRDNLVSIDRQEKKILGLMAGFISRDELRASSSNLSIRISSLGEEMALLKKIEKSFEEQVRSDLSKLRLDFSDVIRQFQFDRLKKEIESKTSKQDFDIFIQENLPKISEYSREFKRVNKFIENQEKAITRIDELLCEKSSKVDLIALREISIDAPLRVMSEELKCLKDSFKAVSDKMKNISKEMNELFQSLEESGSNRLNYDTRLSLIRSELRDLENKITCKADTCEMLLFLEKKASWEDFSHLSEAIETVHVQTKILAAQLTTLPQGVTTGKKAQSQKKIKKKIVDLVVNSNPVTDIFPAAQLKAFVRFPPTPEVFKSRACTPSQRLSKLCTSLQGNLN